MKVASISSPNYTDFGVASGTTYYYVMSACNGYAQSGYSAQSSASPLSGSSGGSLIAPQASATPSLSSTNSVTPQIGITSSNGLSGSSVSSKLLVSALKPPTSLKATAGAGLVKLTFSASTHATSYIIYRSTSSGGPYAQVGTTRAPKFTDTSVTAPTKYYYVVRASDGVSMSEYSAQVSAKISR